MQDAWAVLSHHLMYKREDDIPDQLKRRVNALAGSLDSADFAFQAIREKRDQYIESVSASANRNQISGIKINTDSLISYLRSRFPSRSVPPDEPRDHRYFPMLLEVLKETGYESLDQLDGLLSRTEVARKYLYENFPKDRYTEHYANLPSFEVISAVYIAHPEVRPTMPSSFEQAYDGASGLLDRPSGADGLRDTSRRPTPP